MTFLSYISTTPKPKSEASQKTIKSLHSIDGNRIGVIVKNILRFCKLTSYLSIMLKSIP